jgi:hypothetical protein
MAKTFIQNMVRESLISKLREAGSNSKSEEEKAFKKKQMLRRIAHRRGALARGRDAAGLGPSAAPPRCFAAVRA